MSTVVQIVLDGAVGSYDKRYTYSLPENLKNTALLGCRVTVPFGRGNIKKQGMIMSVSEVDSAEGIKDVYSVVDSTPVLSDEMLKCANGCMGIYFAHTLMQFTRCFQQDLITALPIIIR